MHRVTILKITLIAAIFASTFVMQSSTSIEPTPLATFTPDAPCQPFSLHENLYTLCRFDVARDVPTLHWRDQNSEPPVTFATFARLSDHLSAQGQSLIFAMNAGMYDGKRKPIGLYVEQGEEFKSINQKDGYGNFHLMPNGVYYSRRLDDGSIEVGVKQTTAFVESQIEPDFATQSGPMLVIDGALHPRFIADSPSRKRRNGVGVSADGKTIWFAISETPVNFYSFAALFRDQLETPNALFLDGEVSKLFARNLDRTDLGLPMGPIIAVTRRR